MLKMFKFYALYMYECIEIQSNRLSNRTWKRIEMAELSSA